MEKNIEEPIKRGRGRPVGVKGPKRPSRGGARPNAGRKKGSTNELTISSLLSTLKEKSNGKGYESMLVEDFMQARNNNDTQLTIKYHNLILNKVMNTLAKVEVTDSQDVVEAKKLAFAEALAKLTGIKEDK
jgi:hypothetical protein